MHKTDKWQTRTGRLLYALIVFGIIYILLKYAIGLLLPFAMAWAVSSAVWGLAVKSSKRLGGRTRAWSIFYISVFWCLVFVGILALVAKIGREMGELFEYLSENGEKIADGIGDIIYRITQLPSKIPFLKGFMSDSGGISEQIGTGIERVVQGLAEKGSEIFAGGVGSLIIGTPRAIISLAVGIISSVYLALDYDKIKQYLLSIFSKGTQERIKEMLGRTFRGLKGYTRAYFFLFLITFTELYFGLWILKRKYAFIIAVSVAFFDLLPLFGAGVVLVPWAVILIIGENYAVGIGMLVLFAIITVIRQIAEPRLVGKSLGIHPFASLVSIFIGFRLFGFWGMILAPIGVLVAKELVEEKREEVS